MKNKILFSAMLCLACTFSVTVNAQLEVMSSGDVKASQDVEIVGKVQIQDSLYVEKSAEIKRNLKIQQDVSIGDAMVDNHTGLNVIKTTNGTTNPYYGIKSQAISWTSMPTSSLYGVYSVADADPASQMISGQSIVGIYGMCIKGSNKPTHFAAGVAGIAKYYGGCGIYGGIGAGNLPSSMSSGGLYAGYFDGTTIVNGTLTATTISTTSDERQKENIQTISPESAENIQLLTPVSYTLKQDSTWKYDKEAKELQGVHYGLIAQEVQKVFPELVYERGGQLSINYIELIPLLILEVQKLSEQVEELQKKIDGK